MKRLLLIILIIISGILLKPQPVLANIPGAATGTVKVELPDGTRMVLPNVRIYRTDMWAYPYCPNGQPCFGDKDGVEVIVKADGTYYMGNDGNNPAPVCMFDSGATKCPAGEKDKIDHSTSDNKAPLQACSDPAAQVASNWCGLNCGSNPHRLEPYFPDGVGLPGGLEALGYSKDRGQWISSQGGPFYEGGWGNDFTRNNIDFIFKLDISQHTPTLTPTPTPPPNTPTPTPPISACHCDNLDVLEPNNPRIVQKGELIRFRVYAYTDPWGNPAQYPTKVTRILYTITKDGSVVATGQLPATLDSPNPVERDGKLVERYYGEGTYQIPDNSSAIGVYKIDASTVRANNTTTQGILCGYKTVAGDIDILIAQASTTPNALTRFFNWLIGRSSSSNESVNTRSEVSPQNVNNLVPQDADSLQLGTFVPSDELPNNGCTYAHFQVPYQLYN